MNTEAASNTETVMYDHPMPIGRPFFAKYSGRCAFSGEWYSLHPLATIRAIADGFNPNGSYVNKRYVREEFVNFACSNSWTKGVPEITEGATFYLVKKTAEVLVVTRVAGGIMIKGQAKPKSDAQFRRTLESIVAYRIEAAREAA